jgi:hypothetical protein
MSLQFKKALRPNRRQSMVAAFASLITTLSTPAMADPEEQIPINLVCPEKQGEGTLELITMNKLEVKHRIRVRYILNKAMIVNLAFADKGSHFQLIRNTDLTKEKKANERAVGELFVRRTNALKQEVCEADELVKARYFGSLVANRESLRGAIESR